MRRDRQIKNGIETVGCRNNMIKPISKKQCRNNCKNWNYVKQKCEWGIE